MIIFTHNFDLNPMCKNILMYLDIMVLSLNSQLNFILLLMENENLHNIR